MSSYEAAQAERNRGELVRSKANLRMCVRACPQALSQDCTRWLAEIDRDIARLTVSIRGPAGAALPGASLLVDGVERSASEPLELDPGKHQLTARAAGYAPRSVSVDVARSSSQALTIPLTPKRAGDDPVELAGPIALGSAGLVALAAAGVLAIVGHVDVSAMKDDCAPGCPAERVETVRDLWTAAGVLAGVGGGAAIGGAVWLGVALSPPGQPTSGSLSLTVRF